MKKKLFLFSIIVLALFIVGCGGGTSPAPEAAVVETDLSALPQEVDVATVYELQNRDDVFVLDVREQSEYDEKHIPNINLLPMSELESRIDEIPTDKTVFVTCRSGNRSNQVTQFLRQNGYDNVHNMAGGIIAWEQAGYPVER